MLKVSASATPRIADLQAPVAWRSVDFISDLHLNAAEPATFEAWLSYMAATPADAVFILGDLFEVWVGDDVLDQESGGQLSFEQQCGEVLARTGSRLSLYLMHGNRDFLMGEHMAERSNATLLQDPTALSIFGQRLLLSHADLLCLDDVDYLAFRKVVRGSAWRTEFLAKPLPERQAIARGLREQSEARKQQGMAYADVDAHAAIDWLRAASATTLIHGHTHKPGRHDLGDGYSRVVLSDWDVGARPPRAEVVRLSRDGLVRSALA